MQSFFYFIPKSLRSKFQNYASPGIFLGYSNNPTAYKILDISSNKIILSRNVEFFESNPGDYYTSHCYSNHSNFIPNYEIWGNDNTYYNHNSYTKNYISNYDNNIKSTQYNNTNNQNNTITQNNVTVKGVDQIRGTTGQRYTETRKE